jgi:hypothetical protein
VCNSDERITFVLITRLLNPHLVDFTFLPIGVVGVDFRDDHRFSGVHTTDALSGAQFYLLSPSSTLDVDFLDLSIKKLTKFRVCGVIKSIIEAIQVFILCGTYVTITTNVIE